MNKFNIKNILPALLLVLAMLRFGAVALGQTWSEIQPELNLWKTSAISSDGEIILAANYDYNSGGLLKQSNDGGVNWVNTGPTPSVNKNWQSVVMSANGQYMTAAEKNGRIYRSTDGGANWTEAKPAVNGTMECRIAMSDNGKTILSANWPGRLNKSTDYGATWTELQPAGGSDLEWCMVAISGDGNTYVAGIWAKKNVYVSHNSGTNWSNSPDLSNDTFWMSADLSYNGQIVYVSTTNSLLGPLKSTDGLVSWSEMTVGNTSAAHRGISCSWDGQTLALVFYDEQKIYYSTNGGSTWNTHSIPPNPSTATFEGTAVSVSQDGGTILALTRDNEKEGSSYVYTPYGRIYKGVLIFPESTAPSAGDGTAANPYQIATLANLSWLSRTESVWAANTFFIQTADIDATASNTWYEGAGFSPIGSTANTFNGIYNGNYKTISNLFINRPESDVVGLFGYSYGCIKDLTLVAAHVTGGDYTGTLAGRLSGRSSNCHASGTVTGGSGIGGLVGQLYGDLATSSANVVVSFNQNGTGIGGLVGEFATSNKLLSNCFAIGNVYGFIPGVAESSNHAGGLVGRLSGENNKIENCYSAGLVIGNPAGDRGGLIGKAEVSATVSNSFWDTETSQQPTSAGGTGKTTLLMQTQSTFTAAGWDFDIYWSFAPNNYPALDYRLPTYGGGAGTLASPYQIADFSQLHMLTLFPDQWDKYFIQTADLDASATMPPALSIVLNPIGDNYTPFSGTYDGQNHTIDKLYQTTSGFSSSGLFGSASGATLKNIHITNALIGSIFNSGCLAGSASSTVFSNCHVSGTVAGILVCGGFIGSSMNSTFTKCSANVTVTGNAMFGITVMAHLGGFVGTVQGSSSFTDCYARGAVSGYQIGGFVGGVDIGSTILVGGLPIDPTMGFTLSNCYAANTLTVAEGGLKGGLYGQNTYTGSAITITNSFWDQELAGTNDGFVGGSGKSTAEMKTQSTFTDAGWDFATPVWSINSSDNDGYPEITGLTATIGIAWTGATSTDWNTAGNWSSNTVPDASANVTIPGAVNQPVVMTGGSADCFDLTVNDDASLTVQSGGSLITSGSVIGNISIQRTVEGSSNLDAYKYHLVSVPLATSNASQASLFTGSYLYEYLPLINDWNGMGSTTTTGLDETVGYMIYYPNTSSTYTFTGVPNTGAFTPSVTYPGHAENLNFALVPNPYPSNIDWNAATGWTKTNIGSSIWFYNNGNYGVWDGTSGTNGASRYIGVGQAFFVQTTAADPALSMDNGVRTHTAATFLKSGNPLARQLRVRAEANTMSDELLVGFGETTSDAYSASEDALKLKGAATAPQIYTVADNTRLSINNLMAFNTGAAVPMNFETGFEGNVTLSFSQMESFPTSLAIRLEDKLIHQFTDLRTQPTYTFAHQSANASDRFVLHFGSATGIDNNVVNNENVWISEKTVNISSQASVGENALVEIFNTAGQCIYSKQITLSELTRVPVSLSGFAVVRVSTATKVWVAKGIF